MSDSHNLNEHSGDVSSYKDCCGQTWSARIFAGLARISYDAPLAVILVCTLLAGLSGAYTAKYLYFDSNRSNLIKRSEELQARQDRFIAEFPDAEDIVVLAEGGTIEEREAYIDDLALHLRREPETFSYVLEKIEASLLRNYALNYLDIEELKRISSGLVNNRKTICDIASTHSITEIDASFDDLASINTTDEDYKAILPSIVEVLNQLQECIDNRGRFKYKSPFMDKIFSIGAENPELDVESIIKNSNVSMYNTLANGKIHVLLLRPTYVDDVDHAESIKKAIVRLKKIMKGLALQHNTVITRLTGELVLDYDEGESSSEDSMLSSFISIVLVALIFMWAFRELYRPMMAIYALAIGVLWTMGFTTLVIGHLNLLTVTCTTVLIGLGIDYGIHFIYRYEEERVAGVAPLQAMTTTLVHAGAENFTGAFSTALAFLVLNLTDFTGIAELGTIAGGGIILCYLSTVVVLPAFLYLYEKWDGDSPRVGISAFAWLENLERKWLLKPIFMAVLFGIFTIWCSLEACKVRYDYNLLNLQSQDLDSVKAELFLMQSSEHSLLYGISLVSTVEEAKRLQEAYLKLPTVASVECVAMMIPDGYAEKFPYLSAITEVAKEIPLPIPWNPSQGSVLKRLLDLEQKMSKSGPDFSKKLEKIASSSDPEVAKLGKQMIKSLEHLGETLSNMMPGPIGDSLCAFDYYFYGDMRSLIEFMKAQRCKTMLTLDDIPDPLKKREVGKNQLIKVCIFPKENVWNRDAQERFVRDVESVDPQVVGMPIMTYYDSQVLREANEQAGKYALIAIWILLFIYFRNAKLAILALMPKVIGVLWMVGIMGACGVDFNSANFLSLPMILGIGLVFGIHVVHRVLEEDDEGIFCHSTGPAIALAALTTMVGFGTLMIAKYQGIASLGFVMTVGVGANLLSSAVLLPIVIKIMRNNNIKLR